MFNPPFQLKTTILLLLFLLIANECILNSF